MNYIKERTALSIVSGSAPKNEKQKELAEYLAEEIKNTLGTSAELKNDETPLAKHEIVLGDTKRNITEKAYALLTEHLKDADSDTVGYAVLCDGDSVGIVWSDSRLLGKTPIFTEWLVEKEAIDFFISEYLSFGIESQEKQSKAKSFSMTEHLNARAKTIVERKWADFEASLPEEYRADIMLEMRKLYSLYSSKTVDWYASLYDPKTGGFYCSPSARDYDEYMPDLENTWYGLGFACFMGAGELYDNNWVKALPDHIIKKAANWIYNLQDEDGYFYHPHWPKEFIREKNLTSRITRDYSTARILLTEFFGMQPKYEDPAKRALKDGENKVSNASGILSRFDSTENFKAYLAELEAAVLPMTDKERAYKFYEYGNAFQSTTGQMTDEMKLLMKEFFEKYQNPKNGVWTEEVHFDSANGIHKIANVYNKCGFELKYTDEMVRSTMDILTRDPKVSPTRYIVDTYNAWSCFPYIYRNIRYCSTLSESEKEKKIEEYKMYVFANAAEAIRISYENAKEFAFPDGSFSYSRNNIPSSGRAQGAPISKPGVLEGTIDSTLMAIRALTQHLFEALELGEKHVPLYTEAERYKYATLLDKSFRNVT